MLPLLPVLFFFVACLYAMAGFGGGSTYTALLAISGLPLTAIPVISLVCNLIVTSQGSFRLIRKGHASWPILLPLLIGSIPAAFLGGAWRLPESAFLVILASALLLAGIAMLIQSRFTKTDDSGEKSPHRVALLGGGIGLGLLAGVTGIGGGIYLAPVMHLLGWARAHTIATCTSLFIAFNSIAGLAGQLTKGTSAFSEVPVYLLVAFPFAVIVGGRLGSYLLTDKLPKNKIRVITAAVILLVAVRLWIKILFA